MLGDNRRVDVALKNGGGIRDHILGPNITRLTIESALVFANQLSIVELTAAELIATLENGFSRHPSTDGRFPQLAGVRVEVDPGRPAIESAATALEAAIKSDDKAEIEAKIQALSEASAALAQKLYAEEAAGAQPGGPSADADGGGDDAVDAEFEEVKDDASKDGGKKS